MFTFLIISLFGCSEDPIQPTEQQGQYKIAFVSFSNNTAKIDVINSDGTNLTRLTSDTTISNLYPEWSPDGKKIVYVQGHGDAIYVMNSDGSNKILLSTNAGDDWVERPIWSSDGGKIVFTGSVPFIVMPGIFVMNSDGTNEHLVSEGFMPSWSKVGTKIVFLNEDLGRYNQIFTINADGTNKQQLTTDNTSKWNAVFSPDGSRIAFSQRDADVEIYVMNADGTNKQQLTAELGDDEAPNWNPLGTQIAFLSNRTGSGEVYVMNSNGTNQQRLTNNAQVGYSAPSWSPDGAKILFASGSVSGIYVINADGSNQQRLTSGFDLYPVWSPVRL